MERFLIPNQTDAQTGFQNLFCNTAVVTLTLHGRLFHYDFMAKKREDINSISLDPHVPGIPIPRRKDISYGLMHLRGFPSNPAETAHE
jgi:hypothetical protein